MRVIQPEGSKGSLMWMQRLVDRHPLLLDSALHKAVALSPAHHLQWLSPLRNDAWAEYSDDEFLRKIGHGDLVFALKEYWPRRGPQWDALAKDESGRIFLFEAKAHGPEMASSCQAGVISRRIIDQAFEKVKRELGVKPEADWCNRYYQYANRLAHLSFLRRNNVEAYLVFLYFTGDRDIKGPESDEEWSPHIDSAHAHLGLTQKVPYVASIFQPISSL